MYDLREKKKCFYILFYPYLQFLHFFESVKKHLICAIIIPIRLANYSSLYDETLSN